MRSRGSLGICRGGREPLNFDVIDNVSTRARPDSKWRCVLGDRSFDQELVQTGRERAIARGETITFNSGVGATRLH
jgi:hypothetical protein